MSAKQDLILDTVDLAVLDEITIKPVYQPMALMAVLAGGTFAYLATRGDIAVFDAMLAIAPAVVAVIVITAALLKSKSITMNSEGFETADFTGNWRNYEPVAHWEYKSRYSPVPIIRLTGKTGYSDQVIEFPIISNIGAESLSPWMNRVARKQYSHLSRKSKLA